MNDPIVYTDLREVLTAIAQGPFAALLIGYAWSFLAEEFAFWHALSHRFKFALGIVLSGLLPLLATWALYQLDGEILFVNAETAWAIIAHGVIAWIGSQVAYKGGLSKAS